MFLFNKYFHPVNFEFVLALSGKGQAGSPQIEVRHEEIGNGVHRIQATCPSIWRGAHARPFSEIPFNSAALRERFPDTPDRSSLQVSPSGAWELRNAREETVLQTFENLALGVCGKSWVVCVRRNPAMQFFGMGEKSTPFEKSGRIHRFWNTDVFACFRAHDIREHHFDPDYISVPYVIVKQGNEYAGILIDSPFSSVIGIRDSLDVAHQLELDVKESDFFYLGAEGGRVSLYLLYGPTLAELTQKLGFLTGTAPVPPVWSLGFHQSRWGYGSKKDLQKVARKAQEHGFPIDGLWLDIDYMDGYRVFTFAQKQFRSPKKDLAQLRTTGCRVVPILDPGLKKEENFGTYRSASRKGVLCLNPQAKEFAGFVWPGPTVFPDFSSKEGRLWWRTQVERFAALGIEAAWLDMNEPSTNLVDCMDMLFGQGKIEHQAFHNPYALLMAKATREGLERVYPRKRIFLLSRAGHTGSQKYAANWTGDSFSNYFHLALQIPKCLNLSLSGFAFIGTDVGGFAEDCSDQLLIDWTKACFLFPFFRNHSAHDSRDQEPWSRTQRVLVHTRKFTQLRYTFLPYLYNLFVRHDTHAEPILRPLFYEFPDNHSNSLSKIDDQFLVGSSIMHAPFVSPRDRRDVRLPPGKWFDVFAGEWISGNRCIVAKKKDGTTPLFFRDRSIIPIQQGVRTDNHNELADVALLLCFASKGRSEYTYACDDGETLAFREGVRSVYRIEASRYNNSLTLRINTISENAGPVRFTPVTLENFDQIVLEKGEGTRQGRLMRAASSFWSSKSKMYFWE